MVSARQAAKAVEEALSKGEPTIEALRGYHHGYMRAGGKKQACLDVLGMYLQETSDAVF